LFISISYVTIKIGLNIEVMKVVFQAHDIRGWGSFKSRRKTCLGWRTGERKSQAVAQKGKTFFQWHGRKQYFFRGHTRDFLIKKTFSVIHSGIALFIPAELDYFLGAKHSEKDERQYHG
jgi:hypothetical protein